MKALKMIMARRLSLRSYRGIISNETRFDARAKTTISYRSGQKRTVTLLGSLAYQDESKL